MVFNCPDKSFSFPDKSLSFPVKSFNCNDKVLVTLTEALTLPDRSFNFTCQKLFFLLSGALAMLIGAFLLSWLVKLCWKEFLVDLSYITFSCHCRIFKLVVSEALVVLAGVSILPTGALVVLAYRYNFCIQLFKRISLWYNHQFSHQKILFHCVLPRALMSLFNAFLYF